MGSTLLNRFILAVVWTVDYVEAASKQTRGAQYCISSKRRGVWSERELMHLKGTHEFRECLQGDVVGLSSALDDRIRKVEVSMTLSFLVQETNDDRPYIEMGSHNRENIWRNQILVMFPRVYTFVPPVELPPMPLKT